MNRLPTNWSIRICRILVSINPCSLLSQYVAPRVTQQEGKEVLFHCFTANQNMMQSIDAFNFMLHFFFSMQFFSLLVSEQLSKG